MPLLTRVVGTPLTIDIGVGTVGGLAPLLADRRISSGGHVAVVVGPAIQAVEPSITRHVIVPAYVFPEPSAGLIRDHSPAG